MSVGIEDINIYSGALYIDVKDIFKNRNLNMERYDNLMMEEKSVGLSCEDVVTNGVNAAKPIIDKLSDEERNSIELLITSSESGIDFGKSISTYIHKYLGLNKNCCIFEVKQACFGGTAALQMAVSYIKSKSFKGAKALVISTDTARAAAKESYAEPTQAVGAVAMLVSDKPDIFIFDDEAKGNCSYEVMDTCRPNPDLEIGNPDLSLLSYLDCIEECFNDYSNKVEGADFLNTFNYLAFHTPFAGMVKGAHRKMMRQFSSLKTKAIEEDFNRRVGPSIEYCKRIGNVYSATAYVALCSLIDNSNYNQNARVGIFSYGSGCSSQFYSGVISQNSKAKLKDKKILEKLNQRYKLNFDEYEKVIDLNLEFLFGIKNKKVDTEPYIDIYNKVFKGKKLLVLKEIKDYHREYEWS